MIHYCVAEVAAIFLPVEIAQQHLDMVAEISVPVEQNCLSLLKHL